MEKTTSKFLSVHYQLYTVSPDGQKDLEEQTTREHPFQFISGFGIALDAFEQQLVTLPPGSPFDFTLTPQQAFGPYLSEGVHKLEREVFTVNGKFDAENIQPGAVITMLDQEERPFMARIVKVEADGVTVDANHPLAGKTLNFTGLLIENREATLQEIQDILARMNGEGCGHCGHHGEGGCGKHDGDDGCGHHGDGGCCGHCNE